MKSPVMGRIVAIIKTIDGEFDADKVMEIYNKDHINLTNNSVCSSIARLHRWGKLDRVGRGVYVINRFGQNYEHKN